MHQGVGIFRQHAAGRPTGPDPREGAFHRLFGLHAPGAFSALLLILLPALGLIVGTRPAAAISNEECLECHGQQDMTTQGENGEEISLYVAPERFAASVHAGFSCTDCHADITELMHSTPLAPVDCGSCHSDVQEEYSASLHGKALAAGETSAPSCSDCHGEHDILAPDSAESRVNKVNLVATCARCHADPKVIEKLPFGEAAPVANYLDSVHGRQLLVERNPNAPSCGTCHSAHNIRPPTDPASSVYYQNLPKTCAQCHAQEYADYAPSIHGAAVARGNTDSPTCSDCHGEHGIRSPEDPASTVFPANIAKTTCTRCHASAVLGSRYGFSPQRISSYEQTYHGLASRKGSLEVANCASCHGIHAIYPSSDPRSSVNQANLAKTCGGCHPDATARFASINVHPRISDKPGPKPPAEIVRWVYILLLIVVIGGMAVHNGIIWWYHVLEKIRRERLKKRIRRFTRFEAVEHQLFLISFFVLVFTGFALKFPDTGWVHLTERLGLSEDLRALTHRVMAVLMIAVSISHTVFLFSTREGRREMLNVIPKLSDLRDFWSNMAYHLRLRKERPLFPHFDYTEKVEYLALVWGTLVMVATGLVLWFPTIVSRHLPPWAFPVSEVIHYYEAWLAFLAIVVWHFFFVIFHPDVYPINLTFLKGETTVEHALHRHGTIEEEERGPGRPGTTAIGRGRRPGHPVKTS